MKQFFKAHAIWIGLLAVLLGCMLCPSQADAKTKTYQTQDNYYGGGSCSVVISKNKVYYSITETGKIFCYDIKTKKTKTIAKTNGKGFYRLKKKGNYLYAIYDNHRGSDGSDRYIVRVSIKSGKKTTLAKGDNYVLAGKKIYYNKTKFIKSGSYGYEQSAGIYSMTLSGKKKKREKSVTFNNYRYSKTPIKNSKGSVATRGYSKNGYYFSKSLWFTTSKGKAAEIYNMYKDKNASNYGNIEYFTLQGDYIVYKKHDIYSNAKLVLVKTNGKGEKVIYSAPSVSGW